MTSNCTSARNADHPDTISRAGVLKTLFQYLEAAV